LRRKPFAILCLAGLALAAPSAGTLRASKYPPGLHWREIERGGFTIVFPAARAMDAEAALTAAAGINEKLARFWRRGLPGRVRIVLADRSDQPNGFATFFPFDLVGADLAEPSPDSEIAGGRSWIDLVLAHELTHLFTMNAGAPPFRAARRLFGSLPVFYPAAQMPPWAVEGLAVEGESRLTGEGRLNRAPYRLMLNAARRDGLFPGWQRIAGLPAAWPGPAAKYLFGAGFMEFLAEKYGRDSLRKYLERVSGQLLLVGSSRDFRKIFGEPLGDLWQEYAESIFVARRPAPAPLTAGGFFNRYPCALGANSLAYYHQDYRGRGKITLLDLDSGKSRALFKMDAVNGLSFAEKTGKFYLSATEFFHSFSEYSDLYEFDLKNGRLKRLSRGGRLSHPVSRENSEWIYCLQRRNGRYRLALFSKKKGEARSISVSFAGMAQLSLSPDGSRIAAAAKPEGGPWGIAVFHESGALDRFLTVSGSDLSQPRWQENDRLLFIVSEKKTTSLASYAMDTSSAWRLEDPHLSGLRQFDLSRDGREIFFNYSSGRGEEIARRSTAAPPLTPIEISVASGIPENTDIAPAAKPPSSRPYRFWRDLLPRWWSPSLRSSGDEIQVGAMTSGQDALGIHGYTLEGFYGLSSHRANFLCQYVYDGLFPTLSFAYNDSVEYYRGSQNSLRTRELKLASLWPLRVRKRSQLYAYADLHLEKRSTIKDSGTFNWHGSYNGFRLGLSFNSAREYYDSISPADGVRFTLQGTVHPAGLGNDFASRSIQADLRHYISLSRPGVLAWRLAMARSWEGGNRYYDMSGVMAEGILGGGQPFMLMRGHNLAYYRGDRGWQFNLEYRLPLLKIEKAVLPAVSIDRIWLSPFFDAGRLATEYYSPPVIYSAGAETVLRLAFGGAAAYDFALGFAYGFGPEKQWQAYLRTGRSF